MHLFLFVFFFFGSSTNHLFEKIPQMKWLMVTNMAMKSTHEANSDTECFDVLQMFPWAHTSYRSLEFQGISNPHNTRQSYHTHITHHWRVKQVCCNHSVFRGLEFPNDTLKTSLSTAEYCKHYSTTLLIVIQPLS